MHAICPKLPLPKLIKLARAKGILQFNIILNCRMAVLCWRNNIGPGFHNYTQIISRRK
jgi:hypothetical protein